MIIYTVYITMIYGLYAYIWVNYKNLTATEPWESWLDSGKSFPNGRTIEVHEILQCTQICDSLFRCTVCIYIYTYMIHVHAR